ncbi:hypothetical protein JMJ77_0000150 [Colletotrichum scovillei]|uniref:Uncharacterized protein n=1 Tax=Colletotrichum scovillei TaxID=1209932 RepID=A0A9P7R8Y0_9PEZI|nr:hypothetical protein JMJ77_0000150 [Colletotrichum scovillei]KAG7071349.1 hypothetical protein JMJ76_0004222 [Colletotrichum scovillei]
MISGSRPSSDTSHPPWATTRSPFGASKDETYSNPHSSVASRRSSSRDGRSGRRNRGSCA